MVSGRRWSDRGRIGAYVGTTWYRYGDAAPPSRRNGIRCLIDSCRGMTSLNVITSASLHRQP